MRRTLIDGLTFAVLLYGAAFGGVLVAHASASPADTCDPAYTAQCCACEPSEAVEAAPLPRLYLPSVQRDTPPMSAEFTPVHPAPTVTPEVSGDVAR